MRIIDLKKKYGKNVVLDSLNFDFMKNCTLILGDNGSGKTTLFKILAGIIKNYDGNIDVRNDSSLIEVNCIFGQLAFLIVIIL